MSAKKPKQKDGITNSSKNNQVGALWPLYSLAATVARRMGLIVLAIIVIGSAIIIAHQTHQYRMATSEFKSLQDEQSALDLQWQKLRLEQSALAEHSRVEGLAEKKLKMKYLDKNSEVIIETESNPKN